MNQDDFRKLLDAGGGGSRGKSGAYGGSRNLTSLDLDGIRKLSVKKSSKKKGSKSHKDRDDGADGDDGEGSRRAATTGGQYRDRAAERRQGLNVDDMEDADQYKHLDVEQSKFLGGDMAHTHLVKGLDFALLAQLKREKQKLELATAAERLKINGDGQVASKPREEEVDIDQELAKEPTFQTRLGRLVYFLACENQPQSSGKRLQTKSELFLPGRMYYTFNLKSDDMDSKPVVVQRSKEDCPEPDDVVSGMIDDLTLAEVQRVMEQKRSGKKMRRKRPTEDGNTDREEEVAGDDDAMTKEAKDTVVEGSTKPEEEDDDDDDIFPDAGDYVPAYLREDEKPEAPVLKTHDEAGYFSNLSASIAEAEEAARRKEEEAENAWKATLQKAAAAQEKIEKEEAMKARAARMAATQDSYGDYDMGGDSDDDEEQAGKKRKGADAKKDASGGKEIDEDEKDRRKKQKQGNKLANDLKKINKIMESKS